MMPQLLRDVARCRGLRKKNYALNDTATVCRYIILHAWKQFRWGLQRTMLCSIPKGKRRFIYKYTCSCNFARKTKLTHSHLVLYYRSSPSTLFLGFCPIIQSYFVFYSMFTAFILYVYFCMSPSSIFFHFVFKHVKIPLVLCQQIRS